MVINPDHETTPNVLHIQAKSKLTFWVNVVYASNPQFQSSTWSCRGKKCRIIPFILSTSSQSQVHFNSGFFSILNKCQLATMSWQGYIPILLQKTKMRSTALSKAVEISSVSIFPLTEVSPSYFSNRKTRPNSGSAFSCASIKNWECRGVREQQGTQSLPAFDLGPALGVLNYNIKVGFVLFFPR